MDSDGSSLFAWLSSFFEFAQFRGWLRPSFVLVAFYLRIFLVCSGFRCAGLCILALHCPFGTVNLLCLCTVRHEGVSFEDVTVILDDMDSLLY